MGKKYFLFIITFLFIFNIQNTAQQFQKLEKAYSAGTITADEMILNKFYYMFDRTKVNRNLITDFSKPIKCGLPFIMEYKKLKSSLSKSTIAIVEQNLTTTDVVSYYISSGGHFKLTYTTTGVDAVPTADNNNSKAVSKELSHRLQNRAG